MKENKTKHKGALSRHPSGANEKNDHDHDLNKATTSRMIMGVSLLLALAAFVTSWRPSSSFLPYSSSSSSSSWLHVEAAAATSNSAAAAAAAAAATLFSSSSSAQEADAVDRLTKSCFTVRASSAQPEQLNVTFQLYTRTNPKLAYYLSPQISRLELIKSSPFKPFKPIKWITHGFLTNVDKSHWMHEARDKILAFEDANVILTDWRHGASPGLGFYPKAAANAHVVAKMIISILKKIRDDIEMSRVHLIGHSLGAHIIGFVGSAFAEEYLQQQHQMLMLSSPVPNLLTPPNANQLIGRITACDPALPCFGPRSSGPNRPFSGRGSEWLNSHLEGVDLVPANIELQMRPSWLPPMGTHLQPDSALLVEVIHSNPGIMGYMEPLGDYDFYPNGMGHQPGCGKPSFEQPQQHSMYEHVAGAGGYNKRSGARQLSATMGSVSKYMSSIISRFTGGSTSGPAAELNLGDIDVGELSSLAANFGGGAGGSNGLNSVHSLEKFVKPIRELIQGYACSHHRSVEYMVESLYYDKMNQADQSAWTNVCQMVGYRCSDYESFKRGFCFKCTNDLECRVFTMTSSSSSSSESVNHQDLQQQQQQQHMAVLKPPLGSNNNMVNIRSRALNMVNGNNVELSTIMSEYLSILRRRQRRQHQQQKQQQRSFSPRKNNSSIAHQQYSIANRNINPIAVTAKNWPPQASPTTNTKIITDDTIIDSVVGDDDMVRQSTYKKRVLPNLNHNEQQNNFPLRRRNQYFFDTNSARSYCLHHYHILVKYRWFRVRDEIALDGLIINGSPSSMTKFSDSQQQLKLTRFTPQSYTILLTNQFFLSNINSMLVYGERIKATFVDYIEITYMSNLDPKVREAASARLCLSLSQQQQQQQQLSNGGLRTSSDFLDNIDNIDNQPVDGITKANLFVRCTGQMV